MKKLEKKQLTQIIGGITCTGVCAADYNDCIASGFPASTCQAERRLCLIECRLCRPICP